MLLIKRIDETNQSKLFDFLNAVPSIDKIEEDIVGNAVAVFDNDKIIGCVSFENFDSNALIRYFVFKKILSNDVLDDMFTCLEKRAQETNIKKIICIADSHTIEELFYSLGFSKLEKNVFIDEETIKNTNYRNSTVLYKEIIN